MALTCLMVVWLYSCRSLTICSLGALYGFTLGTYDGKELLSPEGSTEGTIGDNIEELLLRYLIGSLYGLEIGINVGN